jgi:N-methylhydantoinase A/oxoprolinase/acetone carboxylase beta subunit
LKRQLHIKKRTLLPFVGRFLVKRRDPVNSLSSADSALLDKLQYGPVSLIELAQNKAYRLFLEERIEKLIKQQLVLHAAFTPTDALHVMGTFQPWDSNAALLGAQLLAAKIKTPTQELCEMVTVEMSDRVAEELITKVLHDEVSTPKWQLEPTATAFLARALAHIPESDLACQVKLTKPVVAVGAPVQAYMPKTTEILHTELIIPEQAGVANALGAVAGSVVQRATALIRPVNFGEKYRLHISGNLAVQPDQIDFKDVDSCISQAQRLVPQYLEDLTRLAGADQVEIKMHRSDHIAEVQDEIGQDVFLETTLTYIAVGRPATSATIYE